MKRRLLAFSYPVVAAAKEGTGTIPTVIFGAGDPAQSSGLASSLAFLKHDNRSKISFHLVIKFDNRGTITKFNNGSDFLGNDMSDPITFFEEFHFVLLSLALAPQRRVASPWRTVLPTAPHNRL